MKKYRGLFAAFLVVAVVLTTFGQVVPSAGTISDLDNIDMTRYSVRYKGDMPDSELNDGGAFAMGSAVWRNYLFVPVNFDRAGSDAKREDLTQLAIYDLSGNKATYLGSWNKTDLGIPAPEVTNQKKDNFIYGVSVSDEYICLLVDMTQSQPTDGNSASSDLALFVYENNLLGATSLPAPIRVNIKTPVYSSKRDLDILNTWWRRGDTVGDLRPYQTMIVPGREGVPSAFVSTYGRHSIAENGGFVTITNITEDESLQIHSKIKEYDLFNYTAADGVTVKRADYLCDVAFKGDKGYFLTRMAGGGDSLIYKDPYAYKSNALAIFTVSFEDPHNPQVIDVTAFDGDCKYNNIDTLTGEAIGNANYCNSGNYYISVGDDDMAYITSGEMNTGVFIDDLPHVFVFDCSGTDVTYVARHELRSNDGKTKPNGVGKMQIAGDILVGGSSTGYNVYLVMLKLSSDRTEVLDRKVDGTISGVNRFVYETLKYGTKVILPHGSGSGAESTSDTNRGTIDIINVLAGGVSWEGEENNKTNVALENVYAKFEQNYLQNGYNTVLVSGENVSDEPMDISIVFGLYKDEVLQKTQVGEKHTIEAGEKINISDSINLEGIEGLDDMVLKAYLWDNMTTIKPLAKTISPQMTEFDFVLSEAAATSAGVYDEDNKLIRTLWGNVKYEAGTHTEKWDGLDDWGNIVPDGNYTVKVLSNNVEYEKLIPVIGNTSDCSTWDSFISSYNMLFDMATSKSDSRIYYCSDHVEGGYGLRYLNSNDLSVNGGLLEANGGNNTATHVASDGQYVYWGTAEKRIYGGDQGEIRAFIWRTDGTGKIAAFTNDTYNVDSKWNQNDTTTKNGLYWSSLRYITKTTEKGVYNYNRIGGVEVQQDGNYLLSAFRDADKVFVNDKTLGDNIFEMDLKEPSAMAMSRSGGSLDNTVYIAYNKNPDEEKGFAIAKYNINSDGSLTKDKDVVTGLDTVLAMALSPDGSTLVVCQGGEQDKIFVYNTADNSLRLTYGTGESYYDDPTVYDDKLMFDDMVFDYSQTYEHSFAEFLDNDSVLVGDSGNTRTLQLNVGSSTAVLEYDIAFQSNSYSATCVRNAENRIFSSKKEYSLDYDKLEEYMASRSDRYDYDGFRDAWKLERNYMLYYEKHFPGWGESLATGFGRAVEQSNGYTYFNQLIGDTNYIFKQAPDGTITDTGVSLGKNIGGKDLQPDMSLWYFKSSGKVKSLYSQACLGYDENQNPIYGEEVLRARIDYETGGDKIPTQSDRYLAITDDERVVFLEAPGPASVILDHEVKHMHLGSLDISGGVATEFDWLAAPGTMRNNNNDFPLDGYFDIQGPPQYTGKFAMAYGNDVIFHYRGEGYKGRQANSFLHFNEDGLLVTVCENNLSGYDGGTNERYGRAGDILEAQPCNSMSTSIATNPTNPDIAYIFQNTEGAAGGVHITRLTGLLSIKTQEIPVVLKRGMVEGIAYTCYESGDLDSTTLINRGVSNTFAIPFITEGEGTNRSVRFEGYFEVDSTDTYPFAVKTDGKVKMWLDSQLIIDSEGDGVGVLYLEANRAYRIMLEVCPSSTGELSRFDVAYMSDGEYVYLDDDKLFCNYPSAGKENTVSLLDGFKFIGKFEFGMYGWTRELSDIYGEKTTANVILSNWNYKREGTVDMKINVYDECVRDSSNKIVKTYQYIRRNLGTVDSKYWKIDADVRYLSCFTRSAQSVDNPRNTDGTSIEVVDADGKYIANFYIQHNGDQPTVLAKGNNQVISNIKKNSGSSEVSSTNYNFFSPYGNDPLTRPNELSFENLGNGKIRITYMGEYLDVEPLDPTANINSPAVFRVASWNNHSVGSSHSWNITKLDLIYDTTAE